MSRIKTIVKGMGTLALALVVSVSGSTGALAIADDTAYTTATVTRGTLLTQAQAKASVYYPEHTTVKFSSDYGSATFVKFTVAGGEYVEAGQVIAEVHVEVDDIAYEELKLRLERAEEDYQEFLTQMETTLQAAEDKVAAATGNEKRIAELELEKKQKEYEERKQSVESNVNSLIWQKEVYETAEQVTEVVAPVSGVVGWLNRYRSGDILYNGSSLGGIYDSDKMLFTITDMTGVLRYGMKVVLKDSMGGEHKGTIVSCNSNAVSSQLRQETAYIQIEDPNPALGYTAAYETIRMEGVLLVPDSARNKDTNGTYVYVLENGRPSKQYIVEAKTVNGQCYVLNGLTEGMQVIIN
ncbi:MAG: hypothetical protein IJY09_10450 [Lachnospiraceae bacterium]|nr:hypothetical protein [Lachnospiraceae bacterium]